MSSPGYVYILFNSAMPSLVKIGQTTRDPSDRAKEIGGTGVPGEFVVAYKEHVPDCVATERRIHRELATHRYSPRREFFTLSLEVAIARVREIANDERAHWIAPVPPFEEATAPTVRDIAADERASWTASDALSQESTAPTIRNIAAEERACWIASAPPSQEPTAPTDVFERPREAVRSEPPAMARVVETPPKPTWGPLSFLVLLLCIVGALCTAISLGVSIQGLVKSSSVGDAFAGMFASVVLVGGCGGVTELLRRAIKKLRSRGL